MPPKMSNLGSKGKLAPPLPNSAPLGSGFIIPTNIPILSDKLRQIQPDLLSDFEVQNTITQQLKTTVQARAADAEDKLPRLNIERVNFSILNADKLDKMKVVNVSTRINRDDVNLNMVGQYDKMGRGVKDKCYTNADGNLEGIVPPAQSVTSYTQLGTLDIYKLCETCKKTNTDCPGHLGEIKLNRAFVHPLFRDYLIMVLTSVCNSCSTLFMSKDYIIQHGYDKLSGKNLLKQIAQDSKNLKCRNPNTKCNTNPTYSTRKPEIDKYEIYYGYGSATKELTNPKDIREILMILNGISKEDAELMGFRNGTHPRDMVMQSFAVIPPNSRPYTFREGIIKEDHLTSAYDEIIRDNFKYSKTTDEHKKQLIEKDLYFHISHFIDNSDGKYCRSLTEKIKSIKERIVKKEGLIRSNIMGKRVNFCARSVIGPDHTLKFGEIGVPESMFKVLTIPEMVHEKNLEYIRDLWNKRQIAFFYFGSGPAQRRYRVAESTYNQIFNGKKLQPCIGFMVERYIQDGDVVLSNRQPTLYKYSMAANFIKKVPRKNIGLHMCESKMRQADFDGDEINLHIIQGVDARVEAMTFANIQSFIPDALTAKSMAGMLYSHLVSAYVMTRPAYSKDDVEQLLRNERITFEQAKIYASELMLTKEEMTEASEVLTYKDDLKTLSKRLKKHNIPENSGRALFSYLLPEDLQYYKNFEGEEVIIKDGVLVKGRINDNHIGRSAGTIQKCIWKWYGKERAVAFMTDCTFLLDWFIYNYGFSIGFEDINLSDGVKKIIEDIKFKSINEIKIKIDALGDPSNDKTIIQKAYREAQIRGYLETFAGNIKAIAKKALAPENPLNVMGGSGNKNSAIQITGLKGQEIVYNKRPQPKISNGQRCLPYQNFNSADIKDRGFISNSFLRGMTPSELYFISEGAREGSNSIALNTADSGALSRKLFKCLEDCKLSYDGSVRNATNAIFQFSYMDGYDAGELVNTSSKNTGPIASFINLQEAVDRINAEFS